MPRKSRIDAPGALHHITAYGTGGDAIFRDDADREGFIERLAAILVETRTPCLAWALLENHFHMLLKTGNAPITTVMRRLLTAYAVAFNRRHQRQGNVFRTRYKSILCQEDAYLTELVRYIHLNPIRAGLVSDIDMLDRYPYAGHSAIIGQVPRTWQDTQAVLARFAKTARPARNAYRRFVQAGIGQGQRNELTGGGLVRSAGGWAEVTAKRTAGVPVKSDERILGDSRFVEQVLSAAGEQMERKSLLRAKGITLDTVAARVLEVLKINADQLSRPGKQRKRVRARSLYCYWAVRELGITMTELSRFFGIAGSAVSQAVARGEKLADEEGFRFLDDEEAKALGIRTD
jgi:REP element-mobilizing transposase RayT